MDQEKKVREIAGESASVQSAVQSKEVSGITPPSQTTQSAQGAEAKGNPAPDKVSLSPLAQQIIKPLSDSSASLGTPKERL